MLLKIPIAEELSRLIVLNGFIPPPLYYLLADPAGRLETVQRLLAYSKEVKDAE